MVTFRKVSCCLTDAGDANLKILSLVPPVEVAESSLVYVPVSSRCLDRVREYQDEMEDMRFLNPPNLDLQKARRRDMFIDCT